MKFWRFQGKIIENLRIPPPPPGKKDYCKSEKPSENRKYLTTHFWTIRNSKDLKYGKKELVEVSKPLY